MSPPLPHFCVCMCTGVQAGTRGQPRVSATPVYFFRHGLSLSLKLSNSERAAGRRGQGNPISVSPVLELHMGSGSLNSGSLSSLLSLPLVFISQTSHVFSSIKRIFSVFSNKNPFILTLLAVMTTH